MNGCKKNLSSLLIRHYSQHCIGSKYQQSFVRIFFHCSWCPLRVQAVLQNNRCQNVIQIFKTFIIHGKTLNDVLFQSFGCPNPKCSGLCAVYTTADRNYHIKVVKLSNFFLCFPFDCSVWSGVCKICTYHLLIQFARLKNIANMFCYCSSINAKLVSNFLLSEPNSFVLQVDFNFYTSVGSGVK